MVQSILKKNFMKGFFLSTLCVLLFFMNFEKEIRRDFSRSLRLFIYILFSAREREIKSVKKPSVCLKILLTRLSENFKFLENKSVTVHVFGIFNIKSVESIFNLVCF